MQKEKLVLEGQLSELDESDVVEKSNDKKKQQHLHQIIPLQNVGSSQCLCVCVCMLMCRHAHWAFDVVSSFLLQRSLFGVVHHLLWKMRTNNKWMWIYFWLYVYPSHVSLHIATGPRNVYAHIENTKELCQSNVSCVRFFWFIPATMVAVVVLLLLSEIFDLCVLYVR